MRNELHRTDLHEDENLFVFVAFDERPKNVDFLVQLAYYIVLK
jgi:hypothetical protein